MLSKKIYSIILIWFFIISLFLFYYFAYLKNVLLFPYDWEPTDGDHLNYAMRIFQHLPIYLPLAKGFILSNYTPLYHYILAFFVNFQPISMSFARTLSAIFFFSSTLIAFIHFKNKSPLLLALVFSIFLMIPCCDGFLIDSLQLGPNSLMGLLFISSLVVGNKLLNTPTSHFWKWTLCAVLCSLAFFAKQQGIIATAICLTAFVIHRIKISHLLIFIFSGLLFTIPCLIYLEKVNDHEFLNGTLFKLGFIISFGRGWPDAYIFSVSRLLNFLSYNCAFSLIVFYSFYQSFRKKIKLTIWQISFLLHIPFLCKILINEGGGPNYFITFWFSIVFCVVDFLSSSYFLENKRLKFYFLIFLLINTIFGSYMLFSAVKRVNSFSEVYPVMTNYYNEVNKIIQNAHLSHPPRVLANRGVGALVTNGARIDLEGCTEFSYIWRWRLFPKEYLLDAIKKQTI